jgi:hypothetical protein
LMIVLGMDRARRPKSGMSNCYADQHSTFLVGLSTNRSDSFQQDETTLSAFGR